MKKKLRFLMVIGLIFSISLLMTASPVSARRGRRDYWRDGRRYHRHYRRYHRPRRETIRIRFTDRDIDRLLFIGGIYFLTKAISEAGRRREVVYVSPPPQRVYVPASQPSYTPTAYATTVVTVRNSTSWYVVVDIAGIEMNLYPGREKTTSWMYIGGGQYVEARAYRDRRHKRLVGIYQGDLMGYQIPWRLNFEPRSFG